MLRCTLLSEVCGLPQSAAPAPHGMPEALTFGVSEARAGRPLRSSGQTFVGFPMKNCSSERGTNLAKVTQQVSIKNQTRRMHTFNTFSFMSCLPCFPEKCPRS